MWTGSLNRVSCMITAWLLRETRCLLYPKARKHWRWQKSAVQAGLEKCCGGENDTVKFGSESLTMMAALLFAFNYTHTHTHTHVCDDAISPSLLSARVWNHTHFWVLLTLCEFHSTHKGKCYFQQWVFALEFEWTTYIHNVWQWPKWYWTQSWLTSCIHS